MSHHLPYWRLSGFYFYYFGTLGALIPYWSLYLQDRGFDAAAIGELMALLAFARIIAPNIWGWIADHYGWRMRIVRLTSLAAALCFAGVFVGDSYWWLALVMSLFSFFWQAALPQFEANTLSHLGEQAHRYSQIRLWGSIGFIVAVMGLGEAVEHYSVDLVPQVVFWLYAGIWLVSLSVPDYPAGPARPHYEPLGRLLRRPAVIALLAACFLSQAGHGAYYTFYSIYLRDHGYSPTLISVMWSVGVVAEIVLFVIMHRLLQRFGARNLLLVSLLLAAVRWVMIAYGVESGWVLTAAQLLHAATFGIYHAAAIHLIHQYFRGRHQGRGQALYSSLSFGAGNALGTLISGYLWESPGPAVTFLTATVMCLLGFFIAWRWVDGGEDKPPNTDKHR